ncbi:MgtC/SapB family protein [Chitinibacter fontanus]|uniref:Protein MgtC n=1 Tax=Chitinibacter fontanus TaxID=1737446 RepID=A0A7D5V9M1_9NEIS|nr:MgtC/SapB family protein [Chitinibacter fontanus]QLI81496.1 MgtC/SapB family protein [Chitinibacter fontanus]
MQSIINISWVSICDTLVSLSAAFILGGIVGLERQVRQRTAGLRTNVLVCVGAAIFVDIAMRYHQLHGGSPSPMQVIAYVVSGVGFLGAGAIMREEGNVRGINTAATLWGSAAIGCAAGADMIIEAILATAFVLAANTLLRPMVNRINRQPLDTEVEASYTVHIIGPRELRRELLAQIKLACAAAKIPLHDIDIAPFDGDEIEIEAVLLPTSLDSVELDQLVETLRLEPQVKQAFWSVSTME